MAQLTLVQQLEELMDDSVKAAVPQLPDYLVERFKEYHILQEELDLLEDTLRQRGGKLLGIGRSMPQDQVRSYRTRIKTIKGQMQGLINIAWTMRLGYELYNPPQNWFVGYAERPPMKLFWEKIDSASDYQIRVGNLDSDFSAPMPDFVLEKYEAAKKTGVFSRYLVAAPDPNLFIRGKGALFCDPALIGYVHLSEGNLQLNQKQGGNTVSNLEMQNAVGFLITMWDLEKDRAYARI